MEIAVIGCGNMGSTHIQNLKALPEQFVVGAVYDIDPAVRQRAAEDGLPVCSTLDELLAKPDVEICIVATPNDSHKDLCIACMAAGKHVICEKPATLNPKELMEVLTAAKIYHRVFSVNQNRRWDRDFLTVKALYQSEKYGAPIFIDSRVQGSHGLPGNWLSHKGVGGMLMDWGVHLIDQLLCMIPGKVTQVYAQMPILPGLQCEENAKVLLRFSGGEAAQIQVDTRSYCKLPRWYVMFPEATAVIPNIGDPCILYRQGEQTGTAREGYFTGSGPSRTLAPSEEVVWDTFDIPVDDRFAYHFYQNVADAVRGKASLYVQPQQVIRVMEVLEAAKESERQGCAIRCEI